MPRTKLPSLYELAQQSGNLEPLLANGEIVSINVPTDQVLLSKHLHIKFSDGTEVQYLDMQNMITLDRGSEVFVRVDAKDAATLFPSATFLKCPIGDRSQLTLPLLMANHTRITANEFESVYEKLPQEVRAVLAFRKRRADAHEQDIGAQQVRRRSCNLL